MSVRQTEQEKIIAKLQLFQGVNWLSEYQMFEWLEGHPAWRLLADEKPDDQADCLVTVGTFRGRKTVIAMYDANHDYFIPPHGLPFDNVIAWLPLPKPYEGVAYETD